MDNADILLGCFFDAVENEWSVYLDPVLESPHRVGLHGGHPQFQSKCHGRDVGFDPTGYTVQQACDVPFLFAVLHG
jgi:hypothetical protein